MKSILLLLLATATLTAAPKKAAPDETLSYKKIGEVDLKLHVFNPEGHKSSDRRPAIVFFFGGGWNSGTASQFYPQCQHLASRGMVAISADYRVAKTHGTTPRECVQDGKSAIRWVRQHAKELGIDPERLAAGGGSAGGHVAAATGTLTKFEEKGEDLQISSRPNALVLFNPVYDNGPEGYGHKRVKEYWKDFSPYHNLSKKTPPTVVFLGTKDDLISPALAKAYQAKMKALGVRSDLHLYEGLPHGFFNRGRPGGGFEKTLKEADHFLTSLGYLPKPAPSPRRSN